MLKQPLRAAAAALVLLFIACAPALALHDGVRALPNQKLHFRTGPNTAYTDLYVLPKSTPVVAIEYEEGNGVTWVLCDFEYKGSRVRGYTGLKRMSVDGYIPYAGHANLPRRLVNDADVFASPDLNSTVRRRLSAGTVVTFLEFEGAYCFIEYARGSQVERGYVLEDCFMVDQGVFQDYFPDNDMDSIYVVTRPSARMYASPDYGSRVLFDIPYDSSVTVRYQESLYGDFMSVYYGGLHGYCDWRDLNDLRGLSPLEY